MSQLAYIGVDMKYVDAHGEIKLFVDELTTSFEV
jgi:hypothetical protein